MNSNLLDDRYKQNLFIYHYDYNYFQTFHIHRNETINCKKKLFINLFKMSNFHL